MTILNIATIDQLLKNIDIFGRPICLNYQSRDYYKTYVGGIITLAMITFLILYSRDVHQTKDNVIKFFSYNKGLLNIIEKQSVHYELTTIKSDDPSLLNLNNGEFMFAIRLQQIDFLKNPYLNLTAIQTQNNVLFKNYQISSFFSNQTTDANGVSNRTLKYIKMSPCTLDHWKNFLDKEGTSPEIIMKRFQLSDALCPEQNQYYQIFQQNFIIDSLNSFGITKFKRNLNDQYSIFIISFSENLSAGGNFFNTNFNYVRLSFQTCISNEKNCKTDKQLQTYIETVGYLRAQLFFPGIVINPSLKQYAQKSIDDNFHFTFVPNTINTDQSLIVKTKSKIDTEQFLSIDNRYATEQQGGKKNGAHAVFFLRRSANTLTYDRSFKSVQSFLSELGGIAQVFITIISLIFFLFYGVFFKVSLVNELYDIDYKNNKVQNDNNLKNELNYETQHALNGEQTQKINQLDTNSKQIQPDIFSNQGLIDVYNENDAQIKFQNQSIQQNSPSNFSNILKIVDQKENQLNFENKLNSNGKSAQNFNLEIDTNSLWVRFNNMINQYLKVKISFKYLLHQITCKRYFHDNLFDLVEKSLKHINQDLDISTILYKLQEIEKLKNVLLNENQRNLFSFFPKPLIRQDNFVDQEIRRQSSYQPHYLKSLKERVLNDLRSSSIKNYSDTFKTKQKRKVSMKKEFTQKQHLFTTQKQFNESGSFNHLYQAYMKILQTQEVSQTDQMVNDRLITCLGNDLIGLFKPQNINEQNSECSSPQRFNSQGNQNLSIHKLHSFQKSPNNFNRMRLLKLNTSIKHNNDISIQFLEDDINLNKDEKIIDKFTIKDFQKETTKTENQCDSIILQNQEQTDYNITTNNGLQSSQLNKNVCGTLNTLDQSSQLNQQLQFPYSFKNKQNSKNIQNN